MFLFSVAAAACRTVVLLWRLRCWGVSNLRVGICWADVNNRNRRGLVAGGHRAAFVTPGVGRGVGVGIGVAAVVDRKRYGDRCGGGHRCLHGLLASRLAVGPRCCRGDRSANKDKGPNTHCYDCFVHDHKINGK